MKENIGNFIISNGKLYLNNACELARRNSEEAIELYEVIRVMNGIPLFMEEHLERLESSAKIKDIPLQEKTYYEENLKAIIQSNTIQYGNIKIKIEAFQNKQNTDFVQIKHYYPSQEEYLNGVDAALFYYEREEPQAKIHRPQWRAEAERIKEEKKVYELLLLNKENQLTEGSKSNLFFIRDNCLFTAPSYKVLQGVTRKKILSIASENKIALVENAIDKDEISHFDAAFISGTSPQILALKRIDNINYDVNHPIIRLLSKEYNTLIEKYLKNAKI